MANLKSHRASTAAPKKRHSGLLRQAVLLVLGAGLMVLILSRVTISDLSAIIAQGRPEFLLLAVASAGVIYVVIPLRLQRSLVGAATLSFRAAFPLSVRHSLLLALLPARGGDLVFPWLLARAAGIPIGHAIANLVVIRLCDVTILCVAAAIGVAALFGGTDTFDELLAFVALVAMASLVAALFMADVFRKVSRQVAATRLARSRLHRWLFEAGRGASQMSRRRLLELMMWTLLRWSVSVILLWAVFFAFSLSLDLLQIIFVSAVLNVVAIVPIQTFGSFGIAESALAVALVTLGLDQDAAAATALLTRATWFLIVLIVGSVLLVGARTTWYVKRPLSDR